MNVADILQYIDSLKRQYGGTLSDIAADPRKGLLGVGDRLNQGARDWNRDMMSQMGGLLSVRPEVQEQSMEGLLGTLPMPNAAGIVKPAVANKLKFETKLPDAGVFQEAVSNTPGAQITNEGLLMRVMRNQQPEQGLQDSVRGGVFYLPEGAAQGKHYSTGRNGYGGSERIAGETLIKNPLVAKGGTGGKAPERAYDALKGPGAYAAMRTEALKAFKGPVYVDEFLDNYAPELSGLSDYILENSRKGNQLPYALQEAAVASAVRNAGHDSVLGYSKGKSGHFLSEIFDVRESHYPDKFGGSKVWEDLFK